MVENFYWRQKNFWVKIFSGMKTFSWGWKLFLTSKNFLSEIFFKYEHDSYDSNETILGRTCVLLNGSIAFLVFLCNLVNFQILRTLALENAKRLQIIYEVLLKGTESWVIISTFSQTGFLCRLCRFGLFSAQITRKWPT